MKALDKIYVASFVQNNIFDYSAINVSYGSWWDEEYGARHKIEKGSILKVDNYISSEYINSSYLIAKEDYTITGEIEHASDEDISHLSIPVTIDGQPSPIVDVESSSRESDCIWESCSPENRYATDKPWTLKTEGVVTDYISFQWNDKYNEPGTFSLILVATDENVNLFQEDRYLLIGESNHVMLVEHVEFNNNLKADGYVLQVTGRSIECVLERRIAFPGQGLNTEEYKGNDGLRKAIYNLVYNFFMHPENIAKESSDGQKFFYYPERRVPFMTLPTEEEKEALIKRPFRASVNKSVSKENLLTIIQDLCKQTDLGFKMEIVPLYGNSRCLQWIFSLYTGDDKSYNRKDKSKPLLIFAPKLGNVEAVSTVKDYSEYRNAIFCGVEKDSDGYIDLTKDVSEANYFGEKIGVDIVDSINTNATKLITGVKNALTTKLEASPMCYTGILYLAVAAMRKDREYNPTVNSIYKRNSRYFEIYAEPEKDGEINWNPDSKYSISAHSPIYINVYTKVKKVGSDKYELSGFSSMPIYFYNVRQDKFYDIGICPYSGSKTNQIAIPWDGEEGSGSDRYSGYIICDVEYGNGLDSFTNETIEYGVIKPIELWTDDSDIKSIWHYDWCRFNFYSFPSTNSTNKIGTIDIQINPMINQDEAIISYPAEYIGKEQADNIYIVFRHAFGDNQDSYSSKTSTFRLSAVNPASVDVDIEGKPDELDFKSSTAYGWLTTPILRQAISDVNNTTFSKYTGTFKKSALQLWFKTLDKYTTSSEQKRWLCQEYVSESNKTGLERREVFVEEDKSDSTDWNASKINQWQSSLVTISADQDEDEESDEEINKRLLETARKRSGDYRRRRDVDASLYLENYNYLPQNPDDPMGYNLGDIIQVDDGWGNMDKYIISGVTLSMDTTSGPKIVPTFDRYEYLPKQYHQLEWLQVANMILPSKFNDRPVSGASSASELKLGANVYFGAMDTDKQVEKNQNEALGGISEILSESQISFTEIEADLSYTKKEVPSGETPPEYKHIFSLISAIGADRQIRTEFEDMRFDLHIPFAVIQTTYKSPYLFMSKPDEDNENYGLDNENPTHMYVFIGQGCSNYEYDTPNPSYFMGCGYKNIFIPNNESIDDENLSTYIYTKNLTDQFFDRHTYIINRFDQDFPKCMRYEDTSLEEYIFENKTMYYSNSYIEKGSDKFILSKRPLSKNYYYGEKRVSNTITTVEKTSYRKDIIYLKFYIVDEDTKDPISGTNPVFMPCQITWFPHYKYSKSAVLDIIVESGHWYIPPEGTVLALRMYKTQEGAELDSEEYAHRTFYFEDFYNLEAIEINPPEGVNPPYNVSYVCAKDAPDDLGNWVVPIKWPTENALGRKFIGLYFVQNYTGEYTAPNDIYGKVFINSSCVINSYGLPSNAGNRLYSKLDSSLLPEGLNDADNFSIDESYWGQDNYRHPTNYNSIDDLYMDLDLENHIVLGGLGYYRWNLENEDYKLIFDDESSPSFDQSPRGCDASNGVRVYGLKIFDVEGASRYVEFGNSNGIITVNNDDNSYKELKVDKLAYYPNLSSRKLVHDYVPVVYTDADDDALETEKYGLYDLIDQEFVPINYAYNSYATFIEAGGEISNND